MYKYFSSSVPMADLYVPDLMSKMINGVQYIPKSCDLASNSQLDPTLAKISFS